MREVSCEVLGMFFKRAAREKLDPERLVDGTGYSVEHFKNKKERVDWSALVRFLKNCSAQWGEDELVRMGADTFKALKALGLVARVMFDARGFYGFVFEKTTGAGNQAFTCIDATMDELPDGRLKLGMKLHDGYDFSREFFLVCKGNYTYMPNILGLPASEVEMTLLPRGADYVVTLPKGGAYVRNAWRKVTRPLDSRAMALELKDAHHVLKERYEELALARDKVAEHAARLELVNALGRELTGQTDLEGLAAAVEQLFAENFDASCVHFDLHDGDGKQVAVRRDHAGPHQGTVARTLELSASGKSIGRLSAHGGERLNDELVESLASWLSIAFANALHVTELRATQAELEQRVEQRTADLRRASAQLKDSLEKLKEADRARSEFFSNAQHELRTPLTLLLGPVESLARDERLPAAVRDELGASLRSGYRLLKLVNDLLDLSKLEAGQLRLQFATTDLSHVLRETVRPFAGPLKARGVALELDLPTSLPLVADAERLEQVALNLVSNAVKFTPDGGVVRVIASSTDELFSFVVENTGPQIPQAELGKIFDRFAQSSNSTVRRFGSTGLGLAVVKDLVELHGGRILAENTEEGVRFRVELPGRKGLELAPARATQPSAQELRQFEVAATPEISPVPHAAETTGEKPLLLIAEDNTDLRAYLVRNLSADFEILEAADGEAALKLARERLPDLVLSDLMMPKLDGTQLAAELKSKPETQGLPFVLLTARSDLQTKLTGLKVGADDYLVKPFHLEELKARLFTQLRLRQLSQRLAHREKLAALGTLVAGVAHEMRNPLNGIVNSLRPIKEMLTSAPDGVNELLDIAIEGCNRIESISSQLLRQAHPGEWTRSDIDVGENLRTAMALLSHKSLNGPRLVGDYPPNGSRLHVIGDPGALSQVWINLLDNAIQAAGPEGQVTVTAEVADDRVAVEIADNGPGIPPSIVHRIFDPFFTTRALGNGTGLGLSFVREIVEAHGGTVAVQSSPGEGARFRVTLPAANHAQGEASAS